MHYDLDLVVFGTKFTHEKIKISSIKDTQIHVITNYHLC